MKKKKRQVLQGHKRVKTRFIPPLMQIGNIKETSYINDLLPHLVWMSLLIEHMGLRKGISAIIRLVKLAHGLHQSINHVNFAICGNHHKLTSLEKAELLKALEGSGELHTYQEALLPLLQLHPDCPMDYLGSPTAPSERSHLVSKLAEAVDGIFDRYGPGASIVQANVVVCRASTGGLFIAEHIGMPDFDAMINDPESEAGRHAASFARTSSMQEFITDEEGQYMEWPKLFWRRNYRLDTCRLMELEE